MYDCFIGDTHGKLLRYQSIIKQHNSSLCVGDFGFKHEWDTLQSWDVSDHKTNMGNHDHIPYVHTHPNSTGDYGYDNEVFTIRGAESIDRFLRREGFDWFPNEELNPAEAKGVFELYKSIKPRIVVSHDCPTIARLVMFGITDASRTSILLEELFIEHQPDIWIFGHHHKSSRTVIDNTKFICLSELEVMML